MNLRGLYAITDTALTSGGGFAKAVAEAVTGGARVVQYRDKSGAAERRRREAAELVGICRAGNAVSIVNDDVALARAVAADGVHVGAEDCGCARARERLGAEALVGVSCYDRLALAEQAVRDGASYVAFGSFFPSPTKPRAVRPPLSLLEEARQLPVPVVAIGGITLENGAELLRAGADMLAVITGVFGAPDIAAAARRYTVLFD